MKNCKRSRILRSSLLALSFCALWSAPSGAVGTRHFVIESGKDFEKGKLEGVAVDSTGYLHAGLDLGSIELLEADSVWAALEHDGELLIGTGNDGKLFRVKAGQAKEVTGIEDALAVTSIVRAFGKTLVGALPGGKLYELKGDKLSDFTELKDAKQIWAMSFDEKSNALYVATGPDGKLFRVTADGTAQVYYDAPQGHLVSVAAHGGRVFAGSSGDARLYEITAPGRAQVIQDFSSTEVRAISVADDGAVFVIVNELTGGPRSDSISSTKPKTPSRPSAKKGKGTLYQFDTSRKPEELYASKDEHFVSLTLDDKGRPVIGTGGEGKVVRVEANHNHAVIADVEERQVTGILGGALGGWVIANDPVVAHPIEGVGGKDAVWTSEVLDAGLRARFGRMSWTATDDVQFETRSGNTKEPDETWTDWSAPLKALARVPSEAGRYLQVRARLVGGEASRVRRISIPFVTDNLRPVLTQITAKSNAQTTGSSGLSSSGGPFDGKTSSKIKLSWDVDNPDEDTLRYRVDYRRVTDKDWFDALAPGEVLTSKSWDWETEDLPEGRYRVRVKASDEPSNTPSRVLTHQLESEVILVDNTAPKLTGLRVEGRLLKGVATDGIGPVGRLEVRVAGESEWIPVDPEDGIFDESKETFEADLSALIPEAGGLVTVRVFDNAGNSHVEHIRVPAAR